jgi:N-methylhydantoinase A
MYNPHWRKPRPLVDRCLRYEISERMLADGTVLIAPSEAEIASLAARCASAGVEAIAVCLLHSYRYPHHEEVVAKTLRELVPDIPVSISSEILREQGEYERTATTAVNAYVRPIMSGYIARLRNGIKNAGIEAPLMIMQSSGGVMSDDDATKRPVYALESGPAAGVIAALGLALTLGYEDAIAFDMGGTTAKASLIEGGRISRGREYEVGGSLSSGSRLLRGSGELLRVPTIDIAEVGAGGGSIAWLDPAGGLHVGPTSAGANPGPACYGAGGMEPTVTDANVVLGYMRSGPIGDGRLTVSAELALTAVAGLAKRMSLPVRSVAQGIHDLANARMMRALRAVSSERGRDPRKLVLIAYGGSGPIHAAGVADDLGVRTVVIPALAGLFSSIGLLHATPEMHTVRTCSLNARDSPLREVTGLYRDMAAELRGSFNPLAPFSLVRTADLRYGGQSWDVEISFPSGRITRSALTEAVAAFEAEHERLYGIRGDPQSPVLIRALRLAAVGQQRIDHAARVVRVDPTPAVPLSTSSSSRCVSFPAGQSEVQVLARGDVTSRATPGPLLVDEYDTTIVVPPHWSVRQIPSSDTIILHRC